MKVPTYLVGRDAIAKAVRFLPEFFGSQRAARTVDVRAVTGQVTVEYTYLTLP